MTNHNDYCILGCDDFATISGPTLGLIQPVIQWVLGKISLEVKRLEREAYHSSLSITEVKDGGVIRPFPIRLHGMVRN
jgi:hypothetical protein